MFSGIPLPTQFSQMPGGIGGMYNALQQGALANQLASLKNQNQLYQNQITAPYAQMANPFAQAALKQAQAQPNLTQAQANQATANAGYLGSETGINEFKLKHPAYLNAEGYLYSQPLNGKPNDGTSTGTNGGAGISVNEHGVIVPDNSVNATTAASANGSAATTNSSTGWKVTPPPNAMVPNQGTPVSPSNTMNASPATPSTAPVNALVPGFLNSMNNQPQTVGQMIMGARIAQSQEAQARAQTAIMEKNSYAYKLMPEDAKNQLASLFNGAGIDQYEGAQELANGKTMNQIFAERGINPADVQPQPLATAADRAKVNQRNAALAEINTLGPIVRAGLGPYIKTIYGRSPAQIVDAISGEDKEKQIAFLEAYGIQPDLAAMRGQAIGLHMGRGILNDLSEKMLSHIKPFQGLVDSDVYEEAQKRIDADVTNAGNAANDAITRVGKVSATTNNDPFNIRKHVK